MIKKNGFTLIELLVVIAIIGILAAIGIPAFQGFQTKAKYNASKSTHTNIKSYILATIVKCNTQSTPIQNNSSRKINFASGAPISNYSLDCPIDPFSKNSPDFFFNQYIFENYTNPYYPTLKNSDGNISIISNSQFGGGSGQLSVGSNPVSKWGYVFFSGLANGKEVRLQTSIGRSDGDFTKAGEVLSEDFLIID